MPISRRLRSWRRAQSVQSVAVPVAVSTVVAAADGGSARSEWADSPRSAVSAVGAAADGVGPFVEDEALRGDRGRDVLENERADTASVRAASPNMFALNEPRCSTEDGPRAAAEGDGRGVHRHRHRHHIESGNGNGNGAASQSQKWLHWHCPLSIDRDAAVHDDRGWATPSESEPEPESKWESDSDSSLQSDSEPLPRSRWRCR